jgi:hypothetical protein
MKAVLGSLASLASLGHGSPRALHFERFALLALALGCAGEAAAPGPTPDPAPESTPGTLTTSTTTGPGEPCDVRAVFDTYCVNCHEHQNYYSYQRAPAVAFTRAELNAKDESGLTLAERVVLRLNDPEAPMPPLLYEPRPNEAERTLVLEWLASGMPAGGCAE